MKIGIKHIIGFLVLGVPLLNFTYTGIMNYSGYCFAENRYLTTDEKFRIAFNFINDNPKTYIRIPEGQNYDFKIVPRIPYSSFEEYALKNPDCCSIGKRVPSEMPPELFEERIFGLDSGKTITLYYLTNYFDPDNNYYGRVNHIYYFVLTNCGRVRRSQTDSIIRFQN